MGKSKLSIKDFEQAAKQLTCGAAEIQAVAEVESRGEAFYSDGFPILLFERHKFRYFTKGKFDKDYPEISNAQPGGYGAGGANQRRKFNLAFSLDNAAAMRACSWGKFQILGDNYKVCGFLSVGDFVDAMKESESAQLTAFVNFVIGNRLDVFLRNHNWARFAAGYNGKNYKINDYHTKLRAAYVKFSNKVSTAKKARAFDISAGNPSTDTVEDAPAPAPHPNDEGADAPIIEKEWEEGKRPIEDVKDKVEVEQVKPETQEKTEVPGIRASLAGAITFITTTGAGLLSWIGGAKVEIIYGLFGAAAIVGTVFIINRFWFANREKQRTFDAQMQREQRVHEIQMSVINSAANKDLNTITIKPVPIRNSDEKQSVMFTQSGCGLTLMQRLTGRI